MTLLHFADVGYGESVGFAVSSSTFVDFFAAVHVRIGGGTLTGAFVRPRAGFY